MGDEIIFSEFSQLMTHNVSMSTARMNMANIEKCAKVTKETYRGMLEKYCYRVLTTEEITSICNDGKEIHLTSKDCDERLTKWFKENEKEEKEEIEHTCSCGECDCETKSSAEEMNVFDTVVALGNTNQNQRRTGVK